MADRAKSELGRAGMAEDLVQGLRPPTSSAIISYPQKARYFVNLPRCDARTIPCVMVNWDNTPRGGKRGSCFLGATPEQYRLALRKAIADVSDRPPDHRLVF